MRISWLPDLHVDGLEPSRSDELSERSCVVAVVLVAIHGHHRSLGMPCFDADGGQASGREPIVEPLRQGTGLETNPFKGAIDPGQNFTDIGRVRNRLPFKEHSAVGIDDADAGHLKRDVESRIQNSGHGRSPGLGFTGKKTTGVSGD